MDWAISRTPDAIADDQRESISEFGNGGECARRVSAASWVPKTFSLEISRLRIPLLQVEKQNISNMTYDNPLGADKISNLP